MEEKGKNMSQYKENVLGEEKIMEGLAKVLYRMLKEENSLYTKN